MRLLIDTHTLLWAYWADPQLSARAIQLLIDLDNQIPASHWEIAIKMKMGAKTGTSNLLRTGETGRGVEGLQTTDRKRTHTAGGWLLREVISQGDGWMPDESRRRIMD